MAETKVKVPEEEERVSIMIPWIEGEDPEVTVGINGVFTKIQRGKQVKVIRSVAEVLQNSYEQSMMALEARKKLKEQVTEL